MGSLTRIVVPCYNEEKRLRGEAFLEFLSHHPDFRFVMVNDGSRDGTLDVLRGLEAAAGGHIDVVDVQPNGGKAEAVRAGLNAALAAEPDVVGYFDADLATPLDELQRMLEVLHANAAIDIVLGSRVQLLGRRIDRNPARHYAGRVFATCASMLLALPVYDTQCGAKLFRADASLGRALARPFETDWVFDVELLGRLMQEREAAGQTPLLEATYELPLLRWEDVKGSKVRPVDFPRALVQLGKLWVSGAVRR